MRRRAFPGVSLAQEEGALFFPLQRLETSRLLLPNSSLPDSKKTFREKLFFEIKF
jgi:hypothetical protein